MKKKIFLIILILIIAFIVITYFHKQKMPETNQINNSSTTSENIVKNVTSENQITSNITPSEITNNSTKTVKYEFTSADSLAAQGNPGILKIFELTNNKIEFEYNHGWNFAESTIDRKISGIAELNDENLYEFTENVDGHKYNIIIKFSEEIVTLTEYIDGDLISRINLWS